MLKTRLWKEIRFMTARVLLAAGPGVGLILVVLVLPLRFAHTWLASTVICTRRILGRILGCARPVRSEP